MKDGFIKTAAVTPRVSVAGVDENVQVIKSYMELATDEHVKVCVFPELCITGYSCGDLFYQDRLLLDAAKGLMTLRDATRDLEGLFFVGLPFLHRDKIYNVAAALSGGEVLGLVQKTHVPAYNEFYESRQFTAGFADTEEAILPDGSRTYIGTKLLFRCENMKQLTVAAEICEDLWVANPPSIAHTAAGATLVVNLSASDELTGKRAYRKTLVETQSARLYCGYVYAGAGAGESTQDVVYSGHSMICENGRTLMESEPFSDGMILSEIDLDIISFRRRNTTTYGTVPPGDYHISTFHLSEEETQLSRSIDPMPFVPDDDTDRRARCEEILDIQSFGLVKRLDHTKSKKAVVGISGGLDSTLALLVTARAFDILELSRKGIIAVTMPGFGTTDRTYQNALSMVHALGATLMEVDIKASVRQHFSDIGQDEDVHDTTYENAQARERTQILMDLANKEGGLVVGTGDLSELALGWATYNGDHMSMYGVNASVPKTLVRHLVKYYADVCAASDDTLKNVLYDVLDTPVSPELLPPENGQIAQKTEELVGPYELHDFFLYHMLRLGRTPKKIFRLARIAFAGTYDASEILKWLETFYRRFFAQQYKRSCLPDGPKVGTVSLSPRGDLRMPSDAVADQWIKEIEELKSLGK
ncbi:MAG: NAD(+) synthase [Lachnospiraceae bacterium]|nr:NAD(+) synthase [Lachnospiraceae bacterium]